MTRIDHKVAKNQKSENSRPICLLIMLQDACKLFNAKNSERPQISYEIHIFPYIQWRRLGGGEWAKAPPFGIQIQNFRSILFAVNKIGEIIKIYFLFVS